MTHTTTSEDSSDCVGFAVRARVRSKINAQWKYKTISRTYHAKSAAIDFMNLIKAKNDPDIRDAWVCAVSSDT